jgi:outer membrane receptor for ferrienterochelin and colicin
LSILLRVIVPAALLVSVSSALFAGTNGVLEGKVRDKRTGELLPGVNVVLPAFQRGTTTNDQGAFLFQDLRAGTYDVRISLIGYQTTLYRNVTIDPDLRTRLTVDLPLAEVELEEIVVQREKPLIQKDVTGTTYIVSGEDIMLLPIDNVAEAMRLKAGVTIEGNVRGGKTSEVLYLVDGLPVQDVLSGGMAAMLPTSSIVGASIMTGGFEAEYGNALSGIVNIVTKTGTDEHRFLARLDRDNWFGGTQVSKASNIELNASGPILERTLRYLLTFHGLFTDTRWWQDFQYVFPSPVETNINGFGKLDYQIKPTLRLGGQIFYSHRDWHDYEFDWRYNLGGLPPEQREASRVAFMLSQSLSDRFFYTASLSRFFLHSSLGGARSSDIRVEEPYQYDFYLWYIVVGRRGWWSSTRQESYTGKVDATLKAGADHMLKFGAEFTQYNLKSDVEKYEPRRTYFGRPILNEPQLDFSSSYGYHPRSGSLYLQDKIDLSQEQGVLVNAGVRYDFLDPTASRPNIEAIPVSLSEYELVTTNTVKASMKHQISPRLGIAMQVAEHGYFFVNFGWYFQYPLFDYLYTGLDRVALAKGVSALTGNPNLEPERTVAYEFSLKYSLPLDLVASATYFKKEMRNQIDSKTFVPGDSKVAGSFGFAEYVNNPFATASGLELTLTRDRGAWINGELSYTYMVTEGSSGSAQDGFYIAQYGLPPAVRLFPLSWDQRHTIKLTSNVLLPWDMNILVLAQYHTGRPYTNYPTSTGFEAVDGGKFVQNNARMPAFFTTDLKAEQRFTLRWWSRALFRVYLDVRNILNSQNVLWMDSNGRIGGELGDPTAYAPGRRTILGIQFDF